MRQDVDFIPRRTPAYDVARLVVVRRLLGDAIMRAIVRGMKRWAR